MRYVGLMAISGFWGVLGYILYRWPRHLNQTVSDHVARGLQRKLYAPTAVVTTIAFAVFMIAWFVPRVDVHVAASILVGLAAFCMVSTTIIPRRDRLIFGHDVLAVSSGVATGGFMLMIAFGSSLTGLSSAVIWGAVAIMTPTGLSSLKRQSHYYLVGQVGYFLTMHVSVLTVAFLL